MINVGQFVATYNVSTNTSDIFENALLKMACIEINATTAMFGNPVDQDRMQISVEFDVDQCNGQELTKLMDYFTARDETVYLEHKVVLGRGGKDKKNQNFLVTPVDYTLKTGRCRLGDGHKYVAYTFNLDSESVTDKIFPEFKTWLAAKVISDPDYL